MAPGVENASRIGIGEGGGRSVASPLLMSLDMHQAHSKLAVVLLLVTAAACTGEMPPPPSLKVTSPQRGLVQSGVGQVTVSGVALPGPDGNPVASVLVNKKAATLAADGSFTASIDVPAGASLIETVAYSQAGGAASDARAVHVGDLRPVGAPIDRAVTASVSADAFKRLSAAAGPKIKETNFTQLLAPLQPMADLGDSLANVKLSITKLTLADVEVALTPVNGGLTFSATLDGVNIAALAQYGGTFVPDGSTTVGMTADQVVISGTLVVTPAGTAGFTTKVTSPTVKLTAMKLQASGLVGSILDLLNNNLSSTIQSVTTRSAERALEPLINSALGGLAGPKKFDVLGKTLDLQASPSALTFSSAGALVTMSLQVKLEGSESSPGFIYTPNGTPTMNVGSGIQLGLADDLVNEMLAEVHAMHLLDLHLDKDIGILDAADLKLAMPPMISANNSDGSLKLILGDMMASFTNHGEPVINAAVNAEVDLAILRGSTPEEIALQFGKVHVWVNVASDQAETVNSSDYDLAGAASAGIGIQLDSLSQFLVTVPVPAVAGVSFDSLAMRADNGYVVVSGDVH